MQSKSQMLQQSQGSTQLEYQNLSIVLPLTSQSAPITPRSKAFIGLVPAKLMALIGNDMARTVRLLNIKGVRSLEVVVRRWRRRNPVQIHFTPRQKQVKSAQRLSCTRAATC
jgi:hypothetical protein